MLAAIQRDHLSRHRRHRQNEADRSADFRRTGAAPERRGAALGLELGVGLPGRRQGRAGSDRIHADAWGQAHRRCARQRPEAGLRGRV